MLFKKREPSLYGDEGALLPPNGVMGRGTRRTPERAVETYNLCERLVAELEALIGKRR